MDNEKKNHSGKDSAKKQSVFTTAEKAQYEVFRNGSITKAQLEEWLRNDIKSIRAFCYTVEHDPRIWEVFVDVHYERYQALHQNGQEAVTNDKS